MSGRKYYFKASDGNEYGPITADEVVDWKKQGRMNSESLVRYEDSDEWLSLGNFSELASAPPPPPQAISIAAQPQHDYDEPHRGGLILGLGIGGLVLSLMCCFTVPIPIALFIALPAWVLGSKDMRKLNAGEMDPTGKGMTQGGLICGIIGTIFALINLLLLVAGILFGLSAASLDNF